MIYWKLSSRHKRLFLLNQLIIIILLGVAAGVAWSVNKIELPTSGERIVAGAGFMLTIFIFVLALLNRLSSLFKVKSLGFLIMFLLFASIGQIIDVLIWTTGLMAIPLVLDDMIFKPIWNNIWYNNYDK